MAERDKNVEFSIGKPRFSFFNRSFTMQASSPKESSIEKPPNVQAGLDRLGSMNRFYNSMESVRGKVKKLCNLFEQGKNDVVESQILSPSKLKLTKSIDNKASSPSLNRISSIWLPGTEDRIVLYLTSLRGIRRTYEDCYAVRMIFRGFRVWVDERDISMDSAYKKELLGVLGQKTVTLPQVFIKGKYIGGADVIKHLFEVGELAKMLEGFPKRKPGFVCETCGDVRFVPCMDCSGSRKIFDEDEGVLKRCTGCNENGLIRCPDCCS